MSDPLEILLYGHQGLRQHSDPVESFDDDLRHLVDAMVRAMAAERGIGLAAPQVGVLKRVIIAQAGGDFSKVEVLVNPHITAFSQERDSFNEGCLSLPGITADVMRPVRIDVQFQDLDGKAQTLTDDALLSRIIQHETDHLEGILFVDHLGLLRRKMIAKKLKALARRAG